MVNRGPESIAPVVLARLTKYFPFLSFLTCLQFDIYNFFLLSISLILCFLFLFFLVAHLHQDLLKTKADIEKYTEETLAQQKDKASDVSL